MRTAEYALEEKKLAKEQAQYEAPTIKRQAEIDYEKAQRALEQSKRNLDTKTKQAVAKMSSVGADLGRQQNQLKMHPGRDRRASPSRRRRRAWSSTFANGTARRRASARSGTPWDPTVATLPDLTQMESQTYINEVDVRKLAVGQKVQISLDADPTKKLDGTVTQIANVGEQRPNQDSKVFEVKIEVAKADTTLRPGMTTANAIEIASVPNVLSIPLEAVTTDGGFSYVYKKDGRGVVRQMIETGAMNDNEIVVQARPHEGRSRAASRVPTDKTGDQDRASSRASSRSSRRRRAPIRRRASRCRRSRRREGVPAAREQGDAAAAPAARSSRRADRDGGRHRAGRARRRRAPSAFLAHVMFSGAHRGRGGRRTTSCARASRRSAFCSASRRSSRCSRSATAPSRRSSSR